MEQSDVFVSYRRKDVDFAKKVVSALKDTGREVWVDWEDIPPGVEGFSDEIQLGIEAANAFIAILSPAYLESEYCLMELREAIRLKKKIIPIVYQKFEPTPPPEGIGHINWVYFTPHAGQENTFEQSFPNMIAALEADHTHTREHTRLLTRAIEWEKRQKGSGFLLSGAEIDQAEAWQVQSASKSPAPTELQLEYVLISRTQQRKQQQRVVVAIGVLLVLAVIAAIYAVFQANEARISEQIAHSESLASAALQAGNEETAIALALEATRSEYAPASVYSALAKVAYPIGGIRYQLAIDEPILPYFTAPGFSSDGEMVAIKNKLYNIATSEFIFEFENAPTISLSAIFLPGDKQVILAGDRGQDESPNDAIYMGLYDVETGKLIHAYKTDIGIAKIELSEDGKTLIAYQPDAKVTWWNVSTGEKLREFETNDLNTLFSPDLKWMAQVRPASSENAGDQTANAVTEIALYNTQTMGVEKTISLERAPQVSIATFSTDSTEIAALLIYPDFYNSELVSFSLDTGQEITAFKNASSSIKDLSYSPDGLSLIGATIEQTVMVWNRQSGEVIKKQSTHHSPVIFADFVRDGKGIASMDDSGILEVWDAIPGNLEKQTTNNAGLEAVSLGGGYLISIESISSDAKEDIVIRDAKTLQERSRFRSPPINQDLNQLNFFDFWLDDTQLDNGLFSYQQITYSEDYDTTSITLYLASLKDGGIIHSWDIDLKSIQYLNDITIALNGKEMYVQYTDVNDQPHLELWDTNGVVLHTYVEPFSGNLSFALNPQGTRMLISTEKTDENGNLTGANLQMQDIATGEVLYTIKTDSVAKIIFTPDGAKFMSVLGDPYGEIKSHITVYESETGKQDDTYTINLSSVANFSIAPDQSSFVTSYGGGGSGGGGDETPSGISFSSGIIIPGSHIRWDFTTGELLWQYPWESGPSVFSTDGKYLYSSWGSIDVWRLDSPQDLIQWACNNRYVPQFTPAELERFKIKSDVGVCETLQQ